MLTGRQVLGLAVATLVLGSCVDPGRGVDAEPSGATVSSASTTAPTTSRSEESLDLPLDWISVQYPLQSFQIGLADARLTAKCMASKGFDLDMGRVFQTPAEPYLYAARYNTYSAAEAATRGYTFPDSAHDEREFSIPDDPEQRAAYLTALTGDPQGRSSRTEPIADPVTGEQVGVQEIPGGCQATVVDELYGSVGAYLQFITEDLWLQGLVGSASVQMRADPRVTALISRWSACMSDQGFQFAQPDDAQGTIWPEPRPGDEEQRVAAADMTCREQVGYLQQMAAVEREKQQLIISQQGEAIQAAQQRRQQVFDAAATVSS